MKAKTGVLAALAFLATTLLFLATASAQANQWNAVPDLDDRDRVVVRRGFDGPRYNAMRTCFRRFRSQVDATYHGALVSITHPDGDSSTDHSNANAYATHVAETWADEGRVDLDTDVVLTVGFTNRSIGVHAGEKWRDFGLTDEAIDDVINATNAPTLMRRRAYGDLMCELLTAVDQRLAILEQESARQIAAAQEIFPDAEAAFATVSSRLRDELHEDSELRQELQARLDTAQPLLDHADHIDRRPTAAIAAAEELLAISQFVDHDIDRALRDLRLLDDLDDRIASTAAAISDRPDASWEGPTAATQILDDCRHLATDARIASTPDLLGVQDCLHQADLALAKSEVRHQFLARRLPLVALLLLLLLAAAAVGLRLLRHRHTAGLLKEDLQSWHRALDVADQKLQHLTRQFSWYFDDRQTFWQGPSGDLDRTIADAVHRAFHLHDQGSALARQASELHQSSHPLDLLKLHKAHKLLRKSKISASSQAPSAPLQLPLTAPFELPSALLLPELDSAFLTAHSGLTEAAPTQQRIAELIASGQTALQQALAEVQTRDEAGLPTDHLKAAVHEAQTTWDEAVSHARAHPTDGDEILTTALAPLQATHSRIEAGNRVLATLEGSIRHLRNKIDASLQKAQRVGVTFRDDLFNPTEVQTETERLTDEIRSLVISGHDQDALQQLLPLQEALEHTHRRLAAGLDAHTTLPNLVRTIESLAPQLKEPLFHLRMRLQRIDTDPDDPILNTHIESMADLQKVAHRIERLVAQIAKDYSEGKILRSIADLTALTDLLLSGTHSMASLKSFIEATTGDAVDVLPDDPLVTAPDGWTDSPTHRWGTSDDASEFRSISLRRSEPSSTQRMMQMT